MSFTNPIDGQRRRRLFTLDSWEMNNFVWTNDNPGNAFPNNHNFAFNANAGFPYLGAAPGLPTPSLAQRDKKINLNYPLPVSNDPKEPIRQKWISDAYELMKACCRRRRLIRPDELAALSQFLVNVIDFRDPDCTMTHFRNPDVKVVLGRAAVERRRPTSRPTWPTCSDRDYTANPGDPPGPVRHGVQPDGHQRDHGLLVPIGERIKRRAPNRLFVELVNTLSQTAIGVETAGRRLWCRHHQSTGCLDARPVAGQLRHGDDRRRPGQPARPVHRPAPAQPVRQILRPASFQPGERGRNESLFTVTSRLPATCSFSDLLGRGAE